MERLLKSSSGDETRPVIMEILMSAKFLLWGRPRTDYPTKTNRPKHEKDKVRREERTRNKVFV